MYTNIFVARNILLTVSLFALDVTSLVSNDQQTLSSECKCPKTYLQVCGIDDKTYQNLCHLECKLKTEQINVRLMHKGPCKSEDKYTGDKDCSGLCENAQWSPVCASNKITYGSLCHFKCEQSKYPSDQLRLKKIGPCRYPYLIKWIRDENEEYGSGR